MEPTGAAPLRPTDLREIGPYRLLGRLGEGGMGTVFLSRAPTGRFVALKVVKAEFANQEGFAARFHAEVDNARRVASFCTAQVLDNGNTGDGRPYMVTEYIAGTPLSDQIANYGALDPGPLHGVALGVAAALAAIHVAGLVHRDLKPANVILSLSGPRVIDFGIARALDRETGFTLSGELLGSPGWWAPEQVRGEVVNPAADIFAWGCLVAYAGNGRHPFGRGDPITLASRVLNTPPDLGALPAPLNDLVRRATSMDPGLRPSAQDLLIALVGGSAPTPVTAADPPTLVATEMLGDWQPPRNVVDEPDITAAFTTPPPSDATGRGPAPGRGTGPGQGSDSGRAGQGSDAGRATGPGQSSDLGRAGQGSDAGRATGPGQGSDSGRGTGPGQGSDPGRGTAPGQSSAPGRGTGPGQGSVPGQGALSRSDAPERGEAAGRVPSVPPSAFGAASATGPASATPGPGSPSPTDPTAAGTSTGGSGAPGFSQTAGAPPQGPLSAEELARREEEAAREELARWKVPDQAPAQSPGRLRALFRSGGSSRKEQPGQQGPLPGGQSREEGQPTQAWEQDQARQREQIRPGEQMRPDQVRPGEQVRPDQVRSGEQIQPDHVWLNQGRPGEQVRPGIALGTETQPGGRTVVGPDDEPDTLGGTRSSGTRWLIAAAAAVLAIVVTVAVLIVTSERDPGTTATPSASSQVAGDTKPNDVGRRFALGDNFDDPVAIVAAAPTCGLKEYEGTISTNGQLCVIPWTMVNPGGERRELIQPVVTMIDDRGGEHDAAALTLPPAILPGARVDSAFVFDLATYRKPVSMTANMLENGKQIEVGF